MTWFSKSKPEKSPEPPLLTGYTYPAIGAVIGEAIDLLDDIYAPDRRVWCNKNYALLERIYKAVEEAYGESERLRIGSIIQGVIIPMGHTDLNDWEPARAATWAVVERLIKLEQKP